MDDLEVIRQFINESDFDEEIKLALLECIAIEYKGGSTSDYNQLLKRISESK